MDRSVLRKDHSVALKLGLLCACLIFTFAVFRSVFAGAALLFDYATLKQWVLFLGSSSPVHLVDVH